MSDPITDALARLRKTDIRELIDRYTRAVDDEEDDTLASARAALIRRVIEERPNGRAIILLTDDAITADYDAEQAMERVRRYEAAAAAARKQIDNLLAERPSQALGPDRIESTAVVGEPG